MCRARLSLVVAASAALLAASPALARARQHPHHASGSASHAELGLGADYIVDPEQGEFNLTVALERSFAARLAGGLRLGVLVTGSPTHFGSPIDLYLKIRTHGIYFEGLLGPWFIFDSGDTLRFHGGVGLGFYLGGGVSAGLEVGFLDHSGIGGLRLAFAF